MFSQTLALVSLQPNKLVPAMLLIMILGNNRPRFGISFCGVRFVPSFVTSVARLKSYSGNVL